MNEDIDMSQNYVSYNFHELWGPLWTREKSICLDLENRGYPETAGFNEQSYFLELYSYIRL